MRIQGAVPHLNSTTDHPVDILLPGLDNYNNHLSRISRSVPALLSSSLAQVVVFIGILVSITTASPPCAVSREIIAVITSASPWRGGDSASTRQRSVQVEAVRCDVVGFLFMFVDDDNVAVDTPQADDHYHHRNLEREVVRFCLLRGGSSDDLYLLAGGTR